ncbi:hypothetical protein OG689_10835 [Kitasatospora sp. NBC_00240]|uniref:hypothetical protein n=1 Tax=Kitasatospora sp. NBC_00240 TaxID=2903567 RepID=UPI0022559B66|nr:hypothetical protein [Kitasatospora sp. NBC_00240]MCX5209779.1 hypothetical protein [Kitasatospora sp. NBC_00240]
MPNSTVSLAPAASEPRITVGIVAVTLPAHGHALSYVWLDPQTCLVGFDPARLTHSIVTDLLQRQLGPATIITDGVPA